VTADAIFSYKDPRSKLMTLCGVEVLIVPPPLLVLPVIEQLKGKTFLELYTAAPAVMVHCVRHPERPDTPMFCDDVDTVCRLRRLPWDVSIEVVETVLEMVNKGK
jgi:hypothetical protein